MTIAAPFHRDTIAARVLPTLRRLFSVDVRSLAAFRIGLGFLIALDIVARFPVIGALYTDQGLLPRGLMEGFLKGTPLDLYRFEGSYAWAVGWIGLTFVCSVLFTVGFQTRAVTVVLWLLMSALFRRNPLATDGGDSMVRCFLFWSAFLPLGACWSIDARRRAPMQSPVCSAASAALLLQPALVYFVAGMVKDSAPWRDGRAVRLALHETLWVRPLGVWLSQQVPLIDLLATATRVIEIGAPTLLFLPVLTLRARALAIALLSVFQIGLATSLRLNFFPFYSSVAWLAFVPGACWDRLFAYQARSLLPFHPGTPPGPWQRDLPRAANIVVFGALVFGTVAGFPATEGSLLTRASTTLGLAQRWYMYRYIDDDYVRVHSVATLADGASIDLRTDQGHLLDSPLDDWARSYRADIVIEAMAGADQSLLRAFARFVCNRWNADPGRRSELEALTFTTRVVWQYRPRELNETVQREPCDSRR